jgi:hypothetical protein
MTDIIILALCLWGIAALFDEGMIFESIGNYLEKQLPRYILKPIMLCPACMSSLWTAAWAYYFDFTIERWLITTFAVCGLNYLVMKFLMR